MGNCLGGEADHNGLIIPNACWVIKTKTVEANSKVFINVVSHANIPKSSNPDEPRIFVGSKKLSRDQKGEECTVIDVLVHDSVVNGIVAGERNRGEQPKALKLNRQIINLMNHNGADDDDDLLGTSFSVPKIISGYKGDLVTPIEQSLIDFAANEKKKGKLKTSNDITTTDVEGSTAGDLGDESLDHGTIEVLDVGKVETEIKSKSSLFGMFGNKTKSKELKTSEPDITKERQIPEVKGAYFRKMGHFIPSMKKRYIQLEAGMLIYYVDDTLAQKKSSIDLADCYVADDIKKVLDHQIYIAPLRCKPPSSERANGKDLLLEMLDEMNILPNMKEEWVSAIEKHIAYATRKRIDSGLEPAV